VVVEFGDGGGAVAEDVFGGVQRAAGDVVDEQVVQADVEGLGEADQRVGRRGDAAGFVAADAPGVGADLFAEFGLGPAVFFAQLADRGPWPTARC